MQYFVSVIIPCRNEEEFIPKCLDSIIHNDYPKDKLEILVADGMSEDNTGEIVRNYSKKYGYIRVLNNPNKFTPFAMNIGIRNSRGDVIMKMDAHTIYQKDYISKCVFYLNKYNADNVGGRLITLPKKNTLIVKAIARSLSNFLGVGNSYFRAGFEKIRWVDAVAFGCFKKEVFSRVGLYDENMIRSQDMDLNIRIKKTGGKILLVPSIVAHYYAPSNFRSFIKNNFVNGVWISYPLKFGKMVFSLRHLVPFAFVIGLIGLAVLSIFSAVFLWLLVSILVLYFLLNMFFSVRIAKQDKKFSYLILLPIIYTVRHITYGLGTIFGFFKILIPK